MLSSYQLDLLSGDDYTEPFNDDIPDFITKEFEQEELSRLSAKEYLLLQLDRLLVELDLSKIGLRRFRYNLYRMNLYEWDTPQEKQEVLKEMTQKIYYYLSRKNQLKKRINALPI